MSHGLGKTFELLATTPNEAAVSVLVRALDSPDSTIREGALRCLLIRRNVSGHLEVLRRLHDLAPRWRPEFDEARGHITTALRDAVLGTDRQLCTNACKVAIWFREYDLVPTLINALEDQANPHPHLAANTVLVLSELLYDALSSRRDYHERRDPQLVRRHVITSLDASVNRFANHKCKEVIESFLLLVGRDNMTLRQILRDPLHGTYRPLVESLTTSLRPGVMRLVMQLLEDTHAPSAIASIVGHRRDVRFLPYLLRRIGGGDLPPAMLRNLKRIERISWLDDLPERLNELDDVQQHCLVKIIAVTGIRRQQKFDVLSFVLRQGSAVGRQAAMRALAEFYGAEANQLAVAALSDDDEEVQAEAVRQTRPRGIPGMVQRLIQMADSPRALVREAVYDSLPEFHFKRFLVAFDTLDDDTREMSGQIVAKIDPNAASLLNEELHSRVRSRCLRALEIAVATGLAPHVEKSLLYLVQHKDHFIRAESMRALAKCPSAAARLALVDGSNDSSVAVQETAEACLEQFDAAADRPSFGGESTEITDRMLKP